MSKFYQKIATPEKGLQQSRAVTGPDRDVNVAQEAANEVTGSIGNAITNLLHGGARVGIALEQMNEDEKKRKESKFGAEADGITARVGEDAELATEALASEMGKNIEDLTVEDIKNNIPKMIDKFMQKDSVQKFDYKDGIKERLIEKFTAYAYAKDNQNKNKRKEKSYSGLKDSVQEIIRQADPENMKQSIKLINDAVEKYVGEGKAIEDTKEAAKVRLLEPMMEQAIRTGDYTLVKKMRSKEMSEFFSDIPDYKNVLNVAEQQSRSTLNKLKQMHYDALEEKAFAMINSGYATRTSPQQFMNELESMYKEFPTDERPSSRDMSRLKDTLLKSFELEQGAEFFREEMKKGNYAALELSNKTKKEKDAIMDNIAAKEIGLQDMSQEQLEVSILSGRNDAEWRRYLTEGYPVPPSVTKLLNTKPSGGPDGYRKHVKIFRYFDKLSHGTTSPITSIMDSDNYSRMLHIENILDKADQGTLTNAEVENAITSFNDDIKKNTNAFGYYVSPKAEASKDEEYTEWLVEDMPDPSWTIDDWTNGEYIKQSRAHNYSLLIDAGLSPEDAREKADEMFEQTHRRFENPDGTEGVLGGSFKSLDPEDIFDYAVEHPSVKNKFSQRGILDNLVGDLRDDLSIRQVSGHTKNKYMQIYWRGKPVVGTRMTAEDLSRNIGEYKAAIRKRIEEEHSN